MDVRSLVRFGIKSEHWNASILLRTLDEGQKPFARNVPVCVSPIVKYTGRMDYEGVVIAESLRDASVLTQLDVVSTKVEPVTEAHKTPWLKQWTLHTVRIPEATANKVAEMLSHALEPDYWYIDFK